MSADGPSIGQLLQAELDRTGETPRAFSVRAQQAGHTLSHTTVYGVLRGSRSRFDLATLDAIADTAGLPREQVYAAAGLPAPGRPFADELPEGVDLLDRRERDAVVELLRVMLDRRGQASAALDVTWRDGPVIITGSHARSAEMEPPADVGVDVQPDDRG